MNIEIPTGDGAENVSVINASVEERGETAGYEADDDGVGVADASAALATTASYYSTHVLPEPAFEVESVEEEKSDLNEYDIPTGAPAAPPVSFTSGVASSR